MWNKRSFQVLLSVYNAEKFIKRCFESLEDSLKDEDWILLVGNDASSDNTLLEITEYIPQSSAKKIHFFNYDKAPTVGAAKNKLIKEAHSFKDEYPAILMMDGDDEMTPERPKMFETAKNLSCCPNSEYVVGAWTRYKQKTIPKSYGWDKASFKNSVAASRGLQFGPWATLFDCNFLPIDGKLFPEDEVNNCGYEDLLTWRHLKTFSDKKPIAHTNKNKSVHSYYVHTESVSNALDQNKVTIQRNSYWALLDMMKEEKRDIFNDPPTEKELNRGIAQYVLKKKYKNALSNMEGEHKLITPIHPLDHVDLFTKKN
jgi:glycosyltransferase involved in cell wall biosynthesis